MTTDHASDRHGELLRRKAAIVARHAAEILAIDAEIAVAQRENITGSAAAVIIGGHEALQERFQEVVTNLDEEQRAVLAAMREELHALRVELAALAAERRKAGSDLHTRIDGVKQDIAALVAARLPP